MTQARGAREPEPEDEIPPVPVERLLPQPPADAIPEPDEDDPLTLPTDDIVDPPING